CFAHVAQLDRSAADDHTLLDLLGGECLTGADDIAALLRSTGGERECRECGCDRRLESWSAHASSSCLFMETLPPEPTPSGRSGQHPRYILVRVFAMCRPRSGHRRIYASAELVVAKWESSGIRAGRGLETARSRIRIQV